MTQVWDGTAAKTVQQAKAEALLQVVRSKPGGILLDDDAYRTLREDGLSRTEVDRALNSLVKERLITLESCQGRTFDRYDRSPRDRVLVRAQALEQSGGGSK